MGLKFSVVPGPGGNMAETIAKESAERVKNLLDAEKIWYSVTEVKSPGLKYIKIEASIKVAEFNHLKI